MGTIKTFLRGAWNHPGWFVAAVIHLATGLGIGGVEGWAGGAVWYVPVLLTCPAVGRANRGDVWVQKCARCGVLRVTPPASNPHH